MSALRESAELVTAEEYLVQERAAEFRSEYFNGSVVAMAGGGMDHALISCEIVYRLRNQFEGRPCMVFNSDMKVRIDRANAFRYPDVSALCGPVFLHDRGRDAFCNPALIVEVLSSSTAALDRGVKFAIYRLLDSLVEYLLVEQESRRAELFRKQPDDVISLESVGATLRLADIYAKVPPASE